MASPRVFLYWPWSSKPQGNFIANVYRGTRKKSVGHSHVSDNTRLNEGTAFHKPRTTPQFVADPGDVGLERERLESRSVPHSKAPCMQLVKPWRTRYPSLLLEIPLALWQEQHRPSQVCSRIAEPMMSLGPGRT